MQLQLDSEGESSAPQGVRVEVGAGVSGEVPCCQLLEKDGGAFGCVLVGGHAGGHAFLQGGKRRRGVGETTTASAVGASGEHVQGDR